MKNRIPMIFSRKSILQIVQVYIVLAKVSITLFVSRSKIRGSFGLATAQKMGNKNYEHDRDQKPLIVSYNNLENVTPRQSPRIKFENIYRLCRLKWCYQMFILFNSREDLKYVDRLDQLPLHHSKNGLIKWGTKIINMIGIIKLSR